jgi:DNA-binding MarR family transcriptional regulator
MPLLHLGLYAHIVACADPFHRGRLRYHRSAALRELSNQLSLLNHHISAHVDLNDTDLDCLELINRHGPLNPSALARSAGAHPATITGILDRLERGGWVARERDPTDRRAIVIRPLRDRNVELFRLYAGMNTAMDQLCASYGDDELQLLADFLHRTTTPDEPPPTSWPATETTATSRPPPPGQRRPPRDAVQALCGQGLCRPSRGAAGGRAKRASASMRPAPPST